MCTYPTDMIVVVNFVNDSKINNIDKMTAIDAQICNSIVML
jgi:hypothetical protein